MLLLKRDYLHNDFYFHVHTELLISKYTTKTNIHTIQSDTLTIGIPEEIPDTTALLLNKKVTNCATIIVSGYFGIGFTGDLSFSETSSLFIQPTFGFTTNVPFQNSRRDSFNSESYFVDSKGEWNKFYLIRSYFRQKLTDKNETTELILGVDIRGFLPTYTPLYSIYIGANIPLNKLKSFF
jgi:hypothetical protein